MGWKQQIRVGAGLVLLARALPLHSQRGQPFRETQRPAASLLHTGEATAKGAINSSATVVEISRQETAASSSVGSLQASMGGGVRQQQASFAETCEYLLGFSKFTWAFLCDLLALFVILLCIPLLLTCSRRRPIGAPIFDCSFFGWKDQSALLASQKVGMPFSQFREVHQG
eukprot:TRINITY_DN76785_c0_g1_i1.p1 TRINITY_DN76785_c0_g1~~TRINITY_DN76785_c0_g1_i1.p1  ORF type:complete len:171 (+),score=29.58 TRINITY_DN76785_c0_g1_i1:44-556(+)